MCFKETRVWASSSCSQGWPTCTATSFSSTGLMRALARIQLRWQRHLTTYQRKWFKLYWSVQRPALGCIDFLVFYFQFHWFFILSLSFSLFCLLCVYFVLFSRVFRWTFNWFAHFPLPMYAFGISKFSLGAVFSCIPWILISCIFIHIQSNVLFLSIFFRT